MRATVGVKTALPLVGGLVQGFAHKLRQDKGSGMDLRVVELELHLLDLLIGQATQRLFHVMLLKIKYRIDTTRGARGRGGGAVYPSEIEK